MGRISTLPAKVKQILKAMGLCALARTEKYVQDKLPVRTISGKTRQKMQNQTNTTRLERGAQVKRPEPGGTDCLLQDELGFWTHQTQDREARGSSVLTTAETIPGWIQLQTLLSFCEGLHKKTLLTLTRNFYPHTTPPPQTNGRRIFKQCFLTTQPVVG